MAFFASQCDGIKRSTTGSTLVNPSAATTQLRRDSIIVHARDIPRTPCLNCSPPTATKLSSSGLHAEAHTAATLLLGCIALHLLADLDIDVEELGHAAVETHGLALVEVAFAVVGRDTLLGAGLGQAVTSALAGIWKEVPRTNMKINPLT